MKAPGPAPQEHTLQVQRLFVEHHMRIKGFVCALLPDFALADDVVQETFLTITRKAHKFVVGTDFLKWACSIARFKVMEARRAASKDLRTFSDSTMELLASAPAAAADDVRTDLLKQCLARLSPKAREAIDLRYHEDRTPAQIAEKLGWSPESAYSVLSRTRTFLRDCIEQRMKEAL
jgi:RNA polymerase sigma-70 factor (ECF subfamily)